MKKCQTCGKVIEHDELCLCKWEKKGMTPIEIIKAWREGKRLEYLREPITGIQLRIFTGAGLRAYYHEYSGIVQEILEVTIKRETFGFDEARKRLEAGKEIGKGDYIYRINNATRTLEYRTQSTAWLLFSGYPLDWPDSVDFYEVEE